MHLVHTKKQKGFILVETIVYVILLGILCFTTVEILITMSRSYGRLRVSQNINHSAVVTLERLTREIRAGDSIDMGASTLNATSGVLMLNGTDDSGNPRTVEFR